MTDQPNMGPRLVVGGGIGVGKSMVLSILAKQGWETINADLLAREVVETGEINSQIKTEWPEAVHPDGTLLREELGRVVFSDPAELAKLEAMVHPVVGGKIAEQNRETADRPLAIELPIHPQKFGTVLTGYKLLVVSAPLHIRRRRLLERGMKAPDIDRRMTIQITSQEWEELADSVIENPGDPDQLQSRLAQSLIDLFGRF